MIKYAKPSSILKFSITIIATIIIIGLVGFFAFGFNNSIEFGNAYQLEASFLNSEDKETVEFKTISVLKDYNISARESKIEDRGFYHTFVVKFKAENLKNIDEIKTKIQSSIYSENASEEEKALVNINTIDSSISKSFGWFIVLSVAIIGLVCFLIGWVRKSIFAGISNFATITTSALLSFALILLTRIELSISTISVVLISLVIIAIFNTILFAKLRELENARTAELDSTSVAVFETILQQKTFGFVALGIIGFISVAFLVSLNLDFIFVALALLIGSMSSMVSSLFIGLPLYAATTELRLSKQKAVLSRNQDLKTKKK